MRSNMQLGRRSLVSGLLSLGVMQTAGAQEAASGRIQWVTYFELAPASTSASAPHLRKYAAEIGAAAGSRSFLLLQEIGRPNRFVAVEAWQDRISADSWNAARSRLREALEPNMISGFDARSHTELSTAPSVRSSGNPVYMVAHVDAFPGGMLRAVDLLRAESAAARNDTGATQFDVLRWDGHPNHFTLVCAWRDRDAAEASLAKLHTRQFRADLTPIEGAPYDGRLYRAWS